MKEEKRMVPIWKKLFYRCIFIPLAWVAAVFKLRLSVRRSKEVKKLKGSYLILATHVSRYDFVPVALTVKPKYFASVIARKMMNRGLMGKVLRTFDGIPKHQYIADLVCIKKIKHYLDDGECVYLCPEGKVSLDGRQSYLSASIAKLIKWLKVPVVFFHASGLNLTSPKQQVVIRPGKCVAESKVLFTKYEAESLSEAEIYDRIREHFVYNDYEYQAINRIRYRTKEPAHRLGLLLYKCPKCGADYTNESGDSTLRCSACGNTAMIDLYGRIAAGDTVSLVFDRPDRWVDYEKAEIEKEVVAEGFKLDEEATLYIEDDMNSDYVKRASGTLTLDGEGIRFTPGEHYSGGKSSGTPGCASPTEAEEFFYPLKNLPTLGPEFDDIYLTCGSKTHQYHFERKDRTYRWTWTVEALHRNRYNNHKEY